MSASPDVFLRLSRMEEARRQIQRQLDMIDRQITRRMTAVIPQLKPQHTCYRRGKPPSPSAFLERYRANLAAITAERQPEIDALSRKLARQDTAIAAFCQRHGLLQGSLRCDAAAHESSYSTPASQRRPAARRRAIMDDAARTAFERLLEVATSDTGQSRRVANFILAWWNADSLSGFDLADIFAVDHDIARSMTIVVARLAEAPAAEYPNAYRAEIENLIRLWRPEIWAHSVDA